MGWSTDDYAAYELLVRDCPFGFARAGDDEPYASYELVRTFLRDGLSPVDLGWFEDDLPAAA